MLWKHTISVIDPYQYQNYDYLSLFDESSQHWKILTKIFNEFEDDFKDEKLFTEYVYVRNVIKNQTYKWILLLTHTALYFLNKKLNVNFWVCLDNI